MRKGRSALTARLAAAGFASALCAAALAQPAPDDPPPAAAAAVPGVPYVTSVVVEGGDQAEIEKIATDVSTLRTLEKEPPPGPPGLVGRARADIEKISAALNATGRYGALVDVTVANVPATSEGAADAAQRGRRPVPVVIRIRPGPVFTFGTVRVQALDAGAAADPVDPAKIGLVHGQPAPAAAIFAAEGRIVDRLRADGYPYAATKGRDVIADHTRKSVDVTLKVAAGPRAPFGEVTVVGTKDVDPKVVRGRVPFQPGERYDPKKIAELRDEVAKLDVFQSIRIREGTEPDASGRVPVTIEVAEKKFRFVGAAAKYDTIDGAGANVYWGHRNLFGGAEKLRVDAEVSRLLSNKPRDYEYRLGAHFEKPGIWTGFDDLILDVEALRERPEAYWRDGVRGAAAIRRRLSSAFSVQIGVEAEASRIRDTVGERDFMLVGVPVGVTFDTTDSKLDPTRGIRATATIAPYFNRPGKAINERQEAADAKSINIFKGQISSYFAFDEAARFILAGKIGVGGMVGPKSTEAVPANRRFFAGGGGSIRGFAYQSASPFCAPVRREGKKRLECDKDQPFGGRSLLETSVEARIKVTDTIGIVPFVDAGAAFDKEFPDFSEDIRIGAGVGLRYYTAIGPIRLDVATPVVGRTKKDSRVALYISIGQSF